MLISKCRLLTKASGMECIDLEYVMAALRADRINICFRTMILFFWKKIVYFTIKDITLHETLNSTELQSSNSALSLTLFFFFLVWFETILTLSQPLARRRLSRDEVNLSKFDLRLSPSQVLLSIFRKSVQSVYNIQHTDTAALSLGLGMTAWTTIIQEVANLIWKHPEHNTDWQTGGGSMESLCQSHWLYVSIPVPWILIAKTQ